MQIWNRSQETRSAEEFPFILCSHAAKFASLGVDAGDHLIDRTEQLVSGMEFMQGTSFEGVVKRMALESLVDGRASIAYKKFIPYHDAVC